MAAYCCLRAGASAVSRRREARKAQAPAFTVVRSGQSFNARQGLRIRRLPTDLRAHFEVEAAQLVVELRHVSEGVLRGWTRPVHFD